MAEMEAALAEAKLEHMRAKDLIAEQDRAMTHMQGEYESLNREKSESTVALLQSAEREAEMKASISELSTELDSQQERINDMAAAYQRLQVDFTEYQETHADKDREIPKNEGLYSKSIGEEEAAVLPAMQENGAPKMDKTEKLATSVSEREAVSDMALHMHCRETEMDLKAGIVQLTDALGSAVRRAEDFEAEYKDLEAAHHRYKHVQEEQVRVLERKISELGKGRSDASSEAVPAQSITNPAVDRAAIEQEIVGHFEKIFEDYKIAAEEEIAHLNEQCATLEDRVRGYELNPPLATIKEEASAETSATNSLNRIYVEDEGERSAFEAQVKALTASHEAEMNAIKDEYTKKIVFLEEHLKEVVNATALVDSAIRRSSFTTPTSPRTAKQRNSTANVEGSSQDPSMVESLPIYMQFSASADPSESENVMTWYVAQTRELNEQITMLRSQNERHLDEIMALRKACAEATTAINASAGSEKGSASVGKGTSESSEALDALRKEHAAEIDRLKRELDEVVSCVGHVDMAIRGGAGQQTHTNMNRQLPSPSLQGVGKPMDAADMIKIVHVQRIVRSYIARRQVMRKLKLKMARETGVLVALRDTVQGESGWYGTDKGIFYFSLVKGQWVHMLGPIHEDDFDHAFRALRRMRVLENAAETLRMLASNGSIVSMMTSATAGTRAGVSKGLRGVMGMENLYLNPVDEKLYVVSSVERHMRLLNVSQNGSV
jgi:chromosome segregation ATPase